MYKYTLKKMMLVISLFLLMPMANAVYADTSVASSTDDAKIMTIAKAEYAKNPILSNTDIDVNSQNGVLQLMGYIDTNVQIKRAAQIGRNIPGVKKVDTSKLVLNVSADPTKDKAITAEIYSKLVVAKLVSARNPTVAIETNNGKVYMDGYVNSSYDLKEIRDMANAVRGVKNVKDNIQVIKAK